MNEEQSKTIRVFLNPSADLTISTIIIRRRVVHVCVCACVAIYVRQCRSVVCIPINSLVILFFAVKTLQTIRR